MEEENKFTNKITSPGSPGKGTQVLYSYSKLEHVSNTQLGIGMISQQRLL